jgi:hypothetical protein
MAGTCVIADGKFQPSGISGNIEPVTFPETPDISNLNRGRSLGLGGRGITTYYPIPETPQNLHKIPSNEENFTRPATRCEKRLSRAATVTANIGDPSEYQKCNFRGLTVSHR